MACSGRRILNRMLTCNMTEAHRNILMRVFEQNNRDPGDNDADDGARRL